MDEQPIATTPKRVTIHGWMFGEDLCFLSGLCVGLRSNGPRLAILEVGTFQGLSTACLLQHGDVACVDTWQPLVEGLDAHDSFEKFQENMRIIGACDRVEIRRGMSQDVLPQLIAEGRVFHMAFVDGDHSYEVAKLDMENALALLVQGGVLAIDDYDWAGVRKAADEIGGFFKVLNTKIAYKVKQ